MHFKSIAIRKYTIRTAIAFIVYAATIVGVTLQFNSHHPHGIAQYIFAELPSIPIVAFIVTFGLYIAEEKDEFVKNLMVLCSLWASAVTMCVTTFLGFLQLYTGKGNLPLFWVFVIWWIVFALAQPLVMRRYR